MPISQLHGIKVNELTAGTRPINPLSIAVIGLLCTAPDAPDVKAKLETGVLATNNALTFTSKLIGPAGNAITVALADPHANTQALSVDVDEDAITVHLATSGAGAITSTAALIKAAIEADADANALIAVAHTGASTGAGVAAAVAATALAGGDAGPFPLDTPVLVTDVRKAIGQAGATGTLKPALEAIADQCSPTVIVVRVAEGEDDAATQANLIGDVEGNAFTGMNAFLAAEAQLGVRPRILGVPGYDNQAVVTALLPIAQQLRAMVYAQAEGADTAAAVTYTQNFSQRELMLIWPKFTTVRAFAGDTVAIALGLRARIDQEIGWHKTLSNVAVNGVLGLAQDVSFDMLGGDTDATLLNEANVTTLVRRDGYRFWGNRTLSDEPLFAFESATRTAQVLQDQIADGLTWAIDKPLTKVLVKDIIETINASFRGLVNAGQLIGANAWYDPALNDETSLAGGQLTIDFDFTPDAPLEGLAINQRITSQYYASFADLVG